jgi:hypothetical protein
MNSEYLRGLVNKLEDINLVIKEEIELTKAHVEHPEDLIFHTGAAGAQQGLQAIVDTVKNPNVVTIKWDGYPALIFGTGMDGKFIICDKHMFNKSDGSGHVTSPKAFQKYDMARGVDRSQLHQTIATIWPGLKQSYSGNGFYWGDLLFSNPLQEQDGLYKFKANPNGITYTVEAQGNWVGELIKDKVAGIAVHQYLPPQATNVQQAQLLNGTIGQLKNSSNVAILPAKMPTVPKLKINKTMIATTQREIDQNKQAADAFLLQPPAGVKSAFPLMCTVFVNKKIVSGNLDNMVEDFIDFAKTRKMSEPVYKKLFGYNVANPESGQEEHVPGHFDNNYNGIIATFKIWIALYNLKMQVVTQLDKAAEASPVKGYLADGTQTQEGFVAHGVKFVNRMGFSRQNLAARG